MLYEAVPYRLAVAAVEAICDGALLASQAAGARPLQATITSPNGGELWDSGLQTIRWEPDDPDHDPLSFSVLLSREGGESWDAPAADLAGSTYQFDTARLAGAERVLIKIIVIDGSNSVEDVSDATFAVASRPPAVEIDWPEDGATLRDDQPMLFTGHVYDPEDGLLAATQTWSSDRDGELGSEAEVVLSRLSKG